jgi:hypothetical protein
MVEAELQPPAVADSSEGERGQSRRKKMGDQNALARVRTDWQGSNAGRGLCSARHVREYKKQYERSQYAIENKERHVSFGA